MDFGGNNRLGPNEIRFLPCWVLCFVKVFGDSLELYLSYVPVQLDCFCNLQSEFQGDSLDIDGTCHDESDSHWFVWKGIRKVRIVSCVKGRSCSERFSTTGAFGLKDLTILGFVSGVLRVEI